MNIDQSGVSAAVRSLALSASTELTPALQGVAGHLARLLGAGVAYRRYGGRGRHRIETRGHGIMVRRPERPMPGRGAA
ncbi:MAG: hypothetical protein WCA36_21350 [Pseudolabrys sp.]|jgi:hypothetical protein